MHDIFRDGKVCIFYHAVGLGDAGETAEGKNAQHQIRGAVSHQMNAAGDFQKAGDAAGKKHGSPFAE